MGLFGRLGFSRPKELISYDNGSLFQAMYSTLFSGSARYKTLTDDLKLRYMLTNPALAKVVFLNCDVFSLLEIKRKDGEENDPLIKLLGNPNKFQTQRQFLWSYRFWLMFGTAYIKSFNQRVDSDFQQLYLLEPTNLIWPRGVLKSIDKMVFSTKAHKDILKQQIYYRYNSGEKESLELGELLTFNDGSNALGNWFKGTSRIDALHKILTNSEIALDSKNVNLNFSKKFLISGNYDPKKDLAGMSTMHDIEKEDIQSKLKSNESVYPVKSQIEIKRFVSDMAKLKLDESYTADLYKIGSMYNIPGDVLDVLTKDSTYENQEKAIGRHIGYSEAPKAIDMIEGLCKHFGLNKDDYEATFNNNSFMQVFEKEKATVNMTNARTLETLIKNGADANEAAELLGIDLKFRTNG